MTQGRVQTASGLQLGVGNAPKARSHSKPPAIGQENTGHLGFQITSKTHLKPSKIDSETNFESDVFVDRILKLTKIVSIMVPNLIEIGSRSDFERHLQARA